MKRTLFLSLALLFAGNAATVQTAQAFNKRLAIKTGALALTGPLMYGLMIGSRKIGPQKTQAIAKGAGTVILGCATWISALATALPTERMFRYDDDSTNYTSNFVIGITITSLLGLATCALGNSTINDIKNWDKNS